MGTDSLVEVVVGHKLLPFGGCPHILGGSHQIIGGIMEEGVEILAWDDVKSRWSGAGIDASHPKRDYHR